MQDTFKYRVSQVLAGDYRQDDIVPVCQTPELVRSVGFSDGTIVMTQKHIRNCLAPEDRTAKEHRHDLPIDFIDNLPSYIESPAMILSSMTQHDSIVLVSDCKDKKERPIIIALKNAGKGTIGGKVISCNVVTSTYGKDEFTNFLRSSLQSNGLLYWNEKKSRDLVVSAGLQLPSLLANHDSDVIIRRYNENVNPLSQKILQDPKSFLPDGYGTTLNRPDGKPFAYSDTDGRQKLWMYTTTPDGKTVLRSTNATFSDGRSELTSYDDHGNVVEIIRENARGQTTYKYSSDGIGYHDSEKSLEYFAGQDSYYDSVLDGPMPLYKSVHEKEHNKEAGRYNYHDKYKENWHEYDGNGNRTLYKHNEYGEDGTTPETYYCSERQNAYNRYGQRTLTIEKTHAGTEIVKQEYYSSSDWYEYYNLTPEDTDGECERPQKSRIYRRADGSVNIQKYEISGEYTELEYSPDGKVASFRALDGTVTTGNAAMRAYIKSTGGELPSFGEVAAATKTLRPSSTSANSNAKKSSGKPNGSGSGSGR